MSTMTRRTLLCGAGASAAIILVGGAPGNGSGAAAEDFEVNRTPDQWRRLLTPAQYAVLREEGTERPGSSRLNGEHRPGVFACAGCNLPLFRSRDKFDSGTGWPSFTRAIAGAVRTRPDHSLSVVRTEVHCRRCGGHLGHVFRDGPPPTGQRWCMNGVAMSFVASTH